MLILVLHLITWSQKQFLNKLVITILLDIIRVDKTQRLIDEGLITNLNDTKKY